MASLTSDYNDVLTTGTGGYFGYDGTADRVDLAAWRTATSKDANSISADPQFTSSTNLHIGNVASPVSNAGTPIAGVTDDFDGDTRDASTPDIGADEFATSPTLARLESVTATQASDGSGTLIEWKTGYEVNNLGFKLYREVGGKRTLVHPSLIAGSAFMSGGAAPAGQSYAWWDGMAAGGQKVQYWLEDVDLSGKATMHGPYAVVSARAGQAVSKQNRATLLSSLGQTEGATKQVERHPTVSKGTGPSNVNNLAGQAAGIPPSKWTRERLWFTIWRKT